MNRIKYALGCLVRLFLVITAPRFAFSLASSGTSGNGLASPIPAKSAPLEFPAKAVLDGRDTDTPSSHAVDARKIANGWRRQDFRDIGTMEVPAPSLFTLATKAVDCTAAESIRTSPRRVPGDEEGDIQNVG